MNDNVIIVSGHQVPVGPVLQHAMLASIEFQNAVLGLAGTRETTKQSFFVGEYDIDLDLLMFAGLPMLTVTVGNGVETATFEYVGGDSIETYALKVADESATIAFLEGNLESDRGETHYQTFGLLNMFGEGCSITLSEIEAKPTDGAEWIVSATAWQSYYDQGLQSDARRRAA